MIDLKRLRLNQHNEQVLLLAKDPSFPLKHLFDLDDQVKTLRLAIESMRKERNDLATQGARGVTETLKEQARNLDVRIKEAEQKLAVCEPEYNNLWLSCPNIPEADLPVGFKEANKPVKIVGTMPSFSFTPKNHLDLNEKLSWFDFQTAANMSGSNFVLYKNEGAKLLYALTTLMLKNNAAHGFQPVIPPYLVHKQALINSGNLPKFEGDFYETQDGICLIPTAEVSLTNIHAKSILDASQLPIRYTAWTSCFRREAGSHGANDRGLIRIHQFEKVELYSICTPEKSSDELAMMLACAESLMNLLQLHYRITLLATQDCSFSAAKTYDIEVWLPGQNRFYEVSSASNCTDFQSRRASIRYRPTVDEKPRLVHTLNCSSLALPRLMVALMEQHQQADGSVILPSALQNVMASLW